MKMGDSEGVAINYGDIGEIYLSIGRDSTAVVQGPKIPGSRKEVLQLAVKYLELNHNLATRMGNTDMVLLFYPALAEAYALTNNTLNALSAYRDLINLKDTEFAKESNIKVANLEAAWNKQKQAEKEQIALRNKQRERIIFIGGICLLLIVVIKEYRNIVAQKRLNATIRKLVGEQEDTIALRTDELRTTNERLVELIQYSAHNMREPLTRVMGAMNIRELVSPKEFDEEIWPQMGKALLDLDNSIKQVVYLAEEVIEG
jgi:signal transduction histidine kinase